MLDAMNSYDPLRAAWEAWNSLQFAEPSWASLLKSAGLEIDGRDERTFRLSLARKISVNRRIPGFEDFSEEGQRGIEPGKPAQSLLYHAVASPSVLAHNGQRLQAFPKLAQIDSIENYVYAAKPPRIATLRAQAGDSQLGIAVFAYEYRCAAYTVHRKHADMCFSRTGLARVGTANNEYRDDIRGFLPSLPGDKCNSIRVLPCRYAAFIAVQLPGDELNFGPMRFRGKGKQRKSDGQQLFWVPLHKLFNGPGCIADHSLEITFGVDHVNEKLRRLHIELRNTGYNSGHAASAIDHAPFRFRSGIASIQPTGGPGSGILVVPCTHRRLVKPAKGPNKNKTNYVTFRMPRIPFTLMTSFWMEPPDLTNRACPEFTHAAATIAAGAPTDLTLKKDFVGRVRSGGYDTLHFLDFTGDGYVKAECPQLKNEIPQSLAAYSLVAPPDFFPLVTQRDLADWFDNLTGNLKSLIWSQNRVNPEPLSDARLAANVEIKGAHFSPDDRTITAIVSGLNGGHGRARMVAAPVVRASCLPDHAAGLFAPGWDTSRDKTGEVAHLSAYGLGSPFPEDMKLCAAESAFWPAATPDTTRFYPQLANRSTTPLPDEYAGWDEVPLPLQDPNHPEIWEYASLGYVNYVQTAMRGGFQLGRLAKVTFAQYTDWTLVMARVHLSLGAKTQDEAARWYVPSFAPVAPDDPEFQGAIRETGANMDAARTYRLRMFKGHQLNNTLSNQPGKVRVQAQEMCHLYADAQTVLIRKQLGRWIKA